MVCCQVDGGVKAAPGRARLDGAPSSAQVVVSKRQVVAGEQASRLHWNLHLNFHLTGLESAPQQSVAAQGQPCRPSQEPHTGPAAAAAAGGESRAHQEPAAAGGESRQQEHQDQTAAGQRCRPSLESAAGCRMARASVGPGAAAGRKCRSHQGVSAWSVTRLITPGVPCTNHQAAWCLVQGGRGRRRRSKAGQAGPWWLLYSPALLCAVLVAGTCCAAGAPGVSGTGVPAAPLLVPSLRPSAGQSEVLRRQTLGLRDERQEQAWESSGTMGPLNATLAQDSSSAAVEQGPLNSALARGFRRAPPVKVVTVQGHTTDFGFVAVKGTGFVSPVVNRKACIEVTAWTRQGLPFDRGSRQEAFFAGLVTRFDRRLRLVADVAYDADYSSHRVCFTPPTTGLYAFQLRLGFVNTADLLEELLEANNRGFVNYTVVLKSTVQVRAGAGRLDRHFGAYRLSLPRCTPGMLGGDLNRGFWLEDAWYPQKCRLNRLEPGQVLRCFNGKSILMAGDSQTRIYFGLLQRFLSYKTRADFLRAFKGLKYNTGDPIQSMPGVPLIGPYDPTTMQYLGPVNKTAYSFLGVKQTWYGGARVGFTILRGRTKLRQAKRVMPISFNITFVTYNDASKAVFQSWMRNRKETHGNIVTDGGGWPYDKVLVANEIHAVRIFPNAPAYRHALTSSLLPQLKLLAKDPRQVFVHGGLSSYDARIVSTNYRSSNPRLEAFEVTSSRLMLLKRFGTFLRVRAVTAPRPDLALEGTHYVWPVSLALLDLWLGSSCNIDASAT